MKTLLSLLIAAAITLSFSARAAEPSEQSVEKLLEISKAGKLLDSAFAQMDGIMKSSMKEVTKGKPLSAEAQATVEKQETKMLNIMKDELSWAKLKPDFVRIYRETFTQEEVDGLIAFYESPSGQAFINKQPALMQNTMAMMQQRMGPMMQKIRKVAEETGKELKAEHKQN